MTETTPARAIAQILAEDAANERALGLLRQTHANGFKGGVRHCANILRAALSPPAALSIDIVEAVEAEREACARVAANWNRHPVTGSPHETSINIAEAIRARPSISKVAL